MRRWGGRSRPGDDLLLAAARRFVRWLSSSGPAHLELEGDDPRLEAMARRIEQERIERRSGGSRGTHPGWSGRRYH